MKTGAKDLSFSHYIASDILSGDFNVNKRFLVVVDLIQEDELMPLTARLNDLYGDDIIVLFKNGKMSDGLVSDIPKVCPDKIMLPGKPLTDRNRFDFYDLTEIMKRLRAENGCEWDKAQTHESIRINLIEEAYELVEAIDCKNRDMMLEESGDVLMQSVFHTEIAEEAGEFNFSDMLTALCRKLIDRHTHIFGLNHADNADEALVFWNEAKKKEKKYASASDAMNRVPKNLPSLLYAEKLLKLAKKTGYKVKSVNEAADGLIKKLEAIKSADTIPDNRAGEILFGISELMRAFKVDAESALHDESLRFYDEFLKFESGENGTEE